VSALFTKICYGEIMKKLVLYIFLGLMWCNVGFADKIVIYCIDDDARGFDTDKNPYKGMDYHPMRFTAKVDLKNFKLNIDGKNYKIAAHEEYMKPFQLYTDGYASSIRFYDMKNYKYYRSIILGNDDSLIIAYGKCSKF
tara:strand:- start:87 stop:503 length:417 start_codon:yes stop_codon:yes gene_type:complete